MERKKDSLVFTLVLCILALRGARDDLNTGEITGVIRHFSELFGINVNRVDPMNG